MIYSNDPKFSDRYASANSADPGQTPLRVYTVCHSVCIVWTHNSMIEPHSSNFRVSTTNFLGVRIFRKFTVCHVYFSFRKGKMYEYEPGKFDSKSLTSFIDYWYMNVQAKPVPVEGSTLWVSYIEPRHKETCLRGLRPGKKIKPACSATETS